MPGQTDLAPYSTGFSSPARRAFAITPSDTGNLPFVTRAIYVGKTGDINVCLIDDEDPVLIAGVKVGTVLALRASRIFATGTTAGDLVGLF